MPDLTDIEAALEDKYLRVTMPDGSRWDVPVIVIARDRAAHYAFENEDGSAEQSLAEDTGPLFLEDDYAIEDWAANEMDWSDVAPYATRVVTPEPKPQDYQEGWVDGDKEVVTVPKSTPNQPTTGDR
jgi:hypothetical protein